MKEADSFLLDRGPAGAGGKNFLGSAGAILSSEDGSESERGSESGSESDSGIESGSESGSDSDSGSGSGSDSDDDDAKAVPMFKVVPVAERGSRSGILAAADERCARWIEEARGEKVQREKEARAAFAAGSVGGGGIGGGISGSGEFFIFHFSFSTPLALLSSSLAAPLPLTLLRPPLKNTTPLDQNRAQLRRRRRRRHPRPALDLAFFSPALRRCWSRRVNSTDVRSSAV